MVLCARQCSVLLSVSVDLITSLPELLAKAMFLLYGYVFVTFGALLSVLVSLQLPSTDIRSDLNAFKVVFSTLFHCYYDLTMAVWFSCNNTDNNDDANKKCNLPPPYWQMETECRSPLGQYKRITSARRYQMLVKSTVKKTKEKMQQQEQQQQAFHNDNSKDDIEMSASPSLSSLSSPFNQVNHHDGDPLKSPSSDELSSLIVSPASSLFNSMEAASPFNQVNHDDSLTCPSDEESELSSLIVSPASSLFNSMEVEEEDNGNDEVEEDSLSPIVIPEDTVKKAGVVSIPPEVDNAATNSTSFATTTQKTTTTSTTTLKDLDIGWLSNLEIDWTPLSSTAPTTNSIIMSRSRVGNGITVHDGDNGDNNPKENNNECFTNSTMTTITDAGGSAAAVPTLLSCTPYHDEANSNNNTDILKEIVTTSPFVDYRINIQPCKLHFHRA